MQLDVTHQDKVHIVKVLDDRIDAAIVLEFKERLRRACADAKGRIVLDLTRVNFVDSSGLGALVQSLKILGTNRAFELCGLTDHVEKVFELTRMDTIFVIHQNLDAALAA